MTYPRLKRLSLLAAPAALVIGLCAAAARAEEDDYAAGRQEYQSACAACHGEAADGNGPIATMFRVPVPALTGLAKANEGKFPFLKLFQIVDGRSVVRAHGDPMPIFGGRFRAEAEAQGSGFGAEAIARGRLLELVLYLQSIQE